MIKFRNNDLNILLATNIYTVRRTTVRNACFVINVGPPKNPQKEVDYDTYIQGAGGICYDLTLVEENVKERLLQDIDKVHNIYFVEMNDHVKLVEDIIECQKLNSP